MPVAQISSWVCNTIPNTTAPLPSPPPAVTTVRTCVCAMPALCRSIFKLALLSAKRDAMSVQGCWARLWHELCKQQSGLGLLWGFICTLR